MFPSISQRPTHADPFDRSQDCDSNLELMKRFVALYDLDVWLPHIPAHLSFSSVILNVRNSGGGGGRL
jgi:hypothetical protein